MRTDTSSHNATSTEHMLYNGDDDEVPDDVDSDEVDVDDMKGVVGLTPLVPPSSSFSLVVSSSRRSVVFPSAKFTMIFSNYLRIII